MPKIEVSEGGVLVTFQRNNVNNNENVTENVLENSDNKLTQLSERQQNIIQQSVCSRHSFATKQKSV